MKNDKSIVHNQGDLSTEDWMKQAWDHRARNDENAVIKRFRKDSVTPEEYWQKGHELIKDKILDKNGERFKLISYKTKPDKMQVLEIGCGMGRLLIPMSEIFGKVVGIDVSPKMLKLCESQTKGLENIEVFENNGKDLNQFENDSFDFCYSFVVFQHIPSKEVVINYISEVSRVLKSGKIFRFQVRGTDAIKPDTSTSTVKGVSFTFEEIEIIATQNNFSIMEHTGKGKQYMMFTFKLHE